MKHFAYPFAFAENVAGKIACYSTSLIVLLKNLLFAATNVFMGRDAVIEYNSVDEYTGEERWDVVGMFKRIVLFVVYVERITTDDNDIIRIISARRAEKKESRLYVNGY